MIRRLISTFIEWNPSNLSHSDFFQQNQIIPNLFTDKKLEHLNWLHDSAPAFPVKANNIQVISEPQQFYDTVLEKSANAKKRIVLASLYLGIGKLETDLVKAIQQNLKENVSLEVNILLDYTRGTRGIVNSKTMLMPLIQQSDNCNLSLYHTPALRGITKKLAPSRWNELLGLQHMKLYLFDDTVIMSGANLSNDYFSNRQDRYIVVEDRRLANFFTNFIAKVQEFSMKVDRDGEVNLHDSWKLSPYQSPHVDFALEAKKRIQNFFHTTYEQQKSLTDEIAEADTWVFPTMEMGQLKIHHDSIVTKKLLATSPKGSTLKMATGYFNLTGNYMDSIVNECEADCSIIMAHPNANGFTGAKGPAGAIPAAYSLLAKRFYETIKKHGQEDRISLLEYERPNWSYHAKGIWYYPHNSSLPFMTVIGSSNYGERSVNRDLESQICLVTTNKRLQNDLQKEYDHLINFASTAESQLIARYVPQWVKIVVGLFKNFF
ncbi:unnamed protein product [Diamesa tonsa]